MLEYLKSIFQREAIEWSTGEVVDMCLLLITLIIPFLTTWTLALIPIRLFGLRGEWRELGTGPGITAVCATGIAIVLLALQVGLASLAMGTELAPLHFNVLGVTDFAPMYVSLAIVTSWFTMLANRCWHTEPSWVDRLGRVAGFSWIIAGFLLVGLLAYKMWDSSMSP